MSGNEHRKLGTAGPLSSEVDVGGRSESSVNAVWFGLMATAVLISIFLLLAIFERFMLVRQTQSQPFDSKIPPFASPKMGVSDKEISVLMPGQDVPTFIAHPCPPSSSTSS